MLVKMHALKCTIHAFRNRLKYRYIYDTIRKNYSQETIQDSEYEQDVKKNILEASLPFVSEFGWSNEALSNGAEVVGYSGVVHSMFKQGGADLFLYFQSSSNKSLVQILKSLQTPGPTTPQTPGEFVERACKERLQMNIPYLSKWPQAVAIMSLPSNVPHALANLLTMVDDICYYTGDRSVDFIWYARRIALAGVYKTTELYLMQDKTKDYEETWKFLNRRLYEAITIQDLINKSDFPLIRAETISAAFVTARNILGLNKIS